MNFLVKAFGATEMLRSLRDDGRIANVQLRVGTSTVMASQVGGQAAQRRHRPAPDLAAHRDESRTRRQVRAFRALPPDR